MEERAQLATVAQKNELCSFGMLLIKSEKFCHESYMIVP
jgi:hypothetical protein